MSVPTAITYPRHLVSEAHPNRQCVRLGALGANGSSLLVEDRAGFEVDTINGNVATAPGCYDVGRQAADLLAQGDWFGSIEGFQQDQPFSMKGRSWRGASPGPGRC